MITCPEDLSLGSQGGCQATDAGMSVVALVQMLEFLSKNRARRMAVFNLNNGEHQLHGAQAYALSYFSSPSFLFPSFDRFLRHPWSHLTSTFLNFEGARSGGDIRSMPPVSSVSIHLNASYSSQLPLHLPIDVA
jgi:hypothetical protein